MLIKMTVLGKNWQIHWLCGKLDISQLNSSHLHVFLLFTRVHIGRHDVNNILYTISVS